MKYKVKVIPCYPFDGHDGKGEVIRFETDDLDAYMKEYQQPRLPFLWKNLAT